MRTSPRTQDGRTANRNDHPHRRKTTITRTLILIAFVLATGCGDSGNPVGPSPTPVLAVPRPGIVPPPPRQFDVRPVDSRFNDQFWQQFVFNQHDDPNPNRDARFSRVLDQNPSPNVYIRMGDPTGRRVVSNQQRDHIQRAVPQLVQQLTGAYRGRVESGIGDRTRQGWITVRFVTQEEEPDISDGACGRARVGQDPGYITIARENCVDHFPEVFAHEFGHAMGFTHVADRTAVMGPVRKSTFNPREQYHAQLAFEVGRHEYCGWPFQRSCATPKRVPRTLGVAPVVID